MYRIRFHGRGGQGVKTASRLLGTAFFLEGYEVQDAPRYGAERRGAPLFAYVRADKVPINERGVISNPDLVMVADDTLVSLPAAGVLQGLDTQTVLAINSFEDARVWKSRLNCQARIVILPGFVADDPAKRPYVSAVLAGAAARLLGLKKDSLKSAVVQELQNHDEAVVSANIKEALSAYDALLPDETIVEELTEDDSPHDPGWIDLKCETSIYSAPTIHAAATSVKNKTGLWRTLRPVIDTALCNRCNWVCGSFCPDNAISADADGYPVIDYDHCKGCLICLAQCPPHAIQAEPENGSVS